jgi:hypothetical protein
MTVADLMRGSLGEGPCEFIMDTAGQGVSNKGIYTCSVHNTLPSLFEFGFQKDERMHIERMLGEVQVFVKAIQDRINGYVDFRAEMLKYLGEQKKAKPELAEFIGKLEAQTGRIQTNKVDGATPVAGLAAQLRPAITADLPKASAEGVTEGIMNIGLGQDNAVARCRNTVKILRQMATIEMAVNPKSAEVAREVRKRTQAALRNPLGHEMR